MDRSDEFLTVDGIEIHVSTWGPTNAEPVVCVHGLTRVGRDFDPIARALAEDYRVYCPDLPGRGLSGWAAAVDRYSTAGLAELMIGFCDELDLDDIRWIGTSLGGGIGIALAGGPLVDRITHLVVNDISPDPTGDADEAALERIVEYVSNPPTLDTITEMESYYRSIYEGRYSEMTDAEWRRFTVTTVRRTDEGRITRGYDPRIVEAVTDGEPAPDRPDPWEIWAGIAADILVLRGLDSEILTESALERMLDLQPTATVVRVDCGHAPALNTPAQIDPIAAVLGS